MGVNIDQSGKDLIIDLDELLGKMPVQIKKKSNRPEARRSSPPIQRFIEVIYEVSPTSRFTKDEKERVPYKRWYSKWKDKLEILNNGFVIFKSEMFVFKNLLEGIIE